MKVRVRGLLRSRSPVHHRGMARISFTPQLQRFTSTPEVDCDAATLRGALEAAFAVNPRLRGYVLDDQGHVVLAWPFGTKSADIALDLEQLLA